MSDRYRAIVEAAADGVWMLDADDRVSFANQAMAGMLGYEVEELVGRPAGELVGRAQGRVAERYETSFRRKDGSVLEAEVSATPLFDEAGEYAGSAAMVVDVTARRRAERERAQLEARLHRAQRLESVGQLAGGVAHDFNNLLAAILNYAHFVRESLPPDSPLRDDVDEIRRAAERAADLTRQLLIFGRRDTVARRVVDLNTIVRDVGRLLARSLGADVALRISVAEDECLVESDPTQLEQVVLNLVLNARDALGAGGTIDVETARAGPKAPSRPAELAPGEYVLLTVRDEGVGMEPEVAARALEPFFTTKPRGAGTGLGLATVYGTVTATGGEVQLETAPGEGTTVRVWLPAAEVGARAGATVLLVEDEEPVRRLTHRILSGSGFECIDAAGGGEALRVYEANRERIDLLLTDVVMPGMSGEELAERIGAGPTGLPVVFMSGYADAEPPGELVEKPFTAERLLRSVRSALAAREGQ